MAKLLSTILDKISEENNSYRDILRDLNKDIEEKTSDYVSEVVTTTNYVLDFSEAVQNANSTIVSSVSRTVESYAIKDLRSVESVNEQFIDKINDKIETTNINNDEDKNKFLNNLNSLLNEKYLEIVKIKRVPFTNESGVNDKIEEAVNEYTKYLLGTNSISEEILMPLTNKYKQNLYEMILSSLDKINSLYLNNFVNEVSSSLTVSIDIDTQETVNKEFKPFEPTINAVTEIPVPDDDIKPIEIASDINPDDDILYNEIDALAEEKDESLDKVLNDAPYEEEESLQNNIPFELPTFNVQAINPVEVKEEPLKEAKRQYDVEEILKIAKSPIVSQNNDIGALYNSVEPLKTIEENESFSSEFNEEEIVEEMIKRLTKRLELLNNRQKAYEEEKEKLNHDEDFVNELINNSNDKKAQLDQLEKELNVKEEELNGKQRELTKKLNDVLPFANAIMKQE